MTISKSIVMLFTKSYLLPYQPCVWVNKKGSSVQVNFKNNCVMSLGIFESRYISKTVSSARDCSPVNDTLSIFSQEENSCITRRMSIIFFQSCSFWKVWRRRESYRCCWGYFRESNSLSLLPRIWVGEGKGKDAGIVPLQAS